MKHTPRFLHAWFVAGTISTLCASACLVGDSKCDENQVEDTTNEMHACVCAPGYVFSSRGYGCEPCGSHEEAAGGKCVCKKGYTRSSESAPCKAPTEPQAGSACSSEQSCNDPFPYCAATEESPYCTTQGCERNDDCPMDWRCSTGGDSKFCQKPPSGYLKACQSDADCDSDAAYCETRMGHACLINDCKQAPSKCLSQSVCCDLTALIDQSLCIPASSLTDGKCFGGTDPVTP